MQEKVAVILVNYNGIEDTLACIESVLKSTIKVNVIVVDNASKRREAVEIRNVYTDVIAIESENNSGFSGGNNLGIRYALEHGYQYILLLNNDTVIDEDMIEKLMSASAGTKITAPTMYYYDEPQKIWYGGGDANRKTGNAKHRYMNSVCDIGEATPVTFITGCCIMLPEKVLRDIGELDDAYFMYCEDLEYSIRIQKKGYEMIHVPTAKLWHKIGSSSGGDESAFAIYYMTRNRLYCIKNNFDYFNKIAYSFTLISRYIRMLQYFVKGKSTWRAFYKGIKDHKKGIMGAVNIAGE